MFAIIKEHLSSLTTDPRLNEERGNLEIKKKECCYRQIQRYFVRDDSESIEVYITHSRKRRE